MANISLDTARSLVSAGGWQVRGGRMAKGVTRFVVVGMIVQEDVVHLYGDKNMTIANDRLTIDMVGDDRPRQIVFSGPFMVKQQRKKIDGGGWHDVEQIGTQLLLINAAAQAEHDAAQAELRQHAAAEAEAKAKADRVRSEEMRDARISTFLARQKANIGNARVVDLVGGPHGLTISFDNGHTLDIDLDGGDLYDVWLNVEGGGEKISLDSGEPPRF